VSVASKWITDLYVLSKLWISGTFYFYDPTPVSIALCIREIDVCLRQKHYLSMELTRRRALMLRGYRHARSKYNKMPGINHLVDDICWPFGSNCDISRI